MSPLELRAFRDSDESVALRGEAALATSPAPFLLDYDDSQAFSTWVGKMAAYERGDVPEDRVRSSFLAACVDGTIVGRLSVRYELNDFLRDFGGHLGYAVLPEFRRRGYAVEILKAGIALLASHGISPVLIAIRDDNLASLGVAERCGAVFESSVINPKGERMLRLWLT